jgi:hypothetical protein
MNYRVYTIAEFMEPEQAIQMNKNFVRRFFPRAVEINGLEQLRKFNRVCETFDTSRLEEVRFVCEWAPRNAYDVVRVPQGVRKVTLDLNRIIRIELPDTVVELNVVRYPYYQCLDMPDSIRKLTLGAGFDSIIGRWSENLEELRMDGWCTGNGRMPVEIERLPNSLKRITLNNDIDIEIRSWPEGLEELVLEGYGPGLENLWWQHAKLDDRVNFVKRPTSGYEAEPNDNDE